MGSIVSMLAVAEEMRRWSWLAESVLMARSLALTSTRRSCRSLAQKQQNRASETWSFASRRYHELYCATVTERWRSEHRPRLPVLLKRGGFEAVGVGIVQPVGTEGEVKLLNPLTMENIASAVLADGLASQHEIDDVVRELYEFAADPNTVAGMPRVVQAWGGGQ
jgi:hypothetical protein